MTDARTLDRIDLEARVKQMYEQVALAPEADFHFETGRGLAEHLGYPSTDLDAVPAPAIDSFAGVGYFLDLAALALGAQVLDLGSGSGMDSFLAANACGPTGRVIGIDMTKAQLAKATRLADKAGFGQVEFRQGYIEDLQVEDGTVDCVISNGVINLSPDKPAVFRAAAGGATARRPSCDRRHRLGTAPTTGRHLRRLAVGRLHRRSRPARRLPRSDPGRRLRARGGARQRLPVHLRPGPRRHHDLRRNQHQRACHEALNSSCGTGAVNRLWILAALVGLRIQWRPWSVSVPWRGISEISGDLGVDHAGFAPTHVHPLNGVIGGMAGRLQQRT